MEPVGRKMQWPAIVPSLLLLLVAGIQIYFAHSLNLTPWKGGGFGMFSTNDHNPHRYLRIHVTALERKEELATLDGLERLGDRVKAFPSEPLLKKLAKEILKVHRSSGLPVEAVQIEVFRIEYAKPNLIPKSRSLRKYNYNSDHE